MAALSCHCTSQAHGKNASLHMPPCSEWVLLARANVTGKCTGHFFVDFCLVLSVMAGVTLVVGRLSVPLPCCATVRRLPVSSRRVGRAGASAADRWRRRFDNVSVGQVPVRVS